MKKQRARRGWPSRIGGVIVALLLTLLAGCARPPSDWYRLVEVQAELEQLPESVQPEAAAQHIERAQALLATAKAAHQKGHDAEAAQIAAVAETHLQVADTLQRQYSDQQAIQALQSELDHLTEELDRLLKESRSLETQRDELRSNRSEGP